MNKNDLFADLRNKLTPIKNYLQLRREWDLLKADENPGYFTITRLEKIQEIMNEELLVCENNFPKVEYIIELLENIE